ncbi:MAG: topoisomerase-4 subunit B [Myxococcota bacterium]|jgi:topoisomerase-4 subunit B
MTDGAQGSGSDYSAGDIKILEGLEAVRKRPGMYIGSTGPRGLHHLVYEIVDNAVDEALAGHCTTINVTIDDGPIITVRDDGRGIPVDIHPQYGVAAATLVFTKLHAGAKFDSKTYKVSGGLHGVGASVVNALSEWLEVEICRGGRAYKQRFERGTPMGALAEVSGTRRRGTTVSFKPDDTIFASTKYSYDTLETRMRELAFLNGGVRITVLDNRAKSRRKISAADVAEAGDIPPAAETAETAVDAGENVETKPQSDSKVRPYIEHCYKGGLIEFVTYLNEERTTVGPPVHFRDTADDIEVEVCFQYHTDYAESTSSFVNCISTVEGGMHETGFRTAHTRVMNEYARRLGVWKKKDNLTGDDLREGMTAILSLRMPEVQFEGQTKTKLGNPEARAAVEQVVAKHLAIFLEENPDIATNILDKAAKASTARQAARKARDVVRKGQKMAGRTSLNGKLTRASSRDASARELFIVEGDSAGGSAKQARDRRIQAILPLRGKPLNTERASLTKVLANKEIMAVIQAIGAGVGSEFNLEDAQYGRIVILADADDDGAHIRCLLLTFFYRFMKDLVTNGHVYIAQPPLYRVTTGKKKRQDHYAWTDEELAKLLNSSKIKGKPDVQRFKGLGEMAAIQLWDTTMNPETRTMVRVEIEDAAAAERSVTILMGDGAAARRRWITEHVAFGPDDDPLEELTETDMIGQGANL